MLFAILFTDNPTNATVRNRDMPLHLAFLERNRDRIRAAGPLRDAESGTPAGGLWLVEAESRQAVEALYREDPFWAAGLRSAVRVLEWTRVFAEGRRLI
jgi:uncharacterized protein YciI